MPLQHQIQHKLHLASKNYEKVFFIFDSFSFLFVSSYLGLQALAKFPKPVLCSAMAYVCTYNNLEICLPNRGYEKRGEDCKEERLIHWRKAK